MKILAVTPVFNEEPFLASCIESMISQRKQPDKWIIVDDGSTDNSYEIAAKYAAKYTWITVVHHEKEAAHQVGSGIVTAFYAGLAEVNESKYDIIMKLDADSIFPDHYMEEIEKEFEKNPSLGICGGICLTLQDGNWKRETFSKKNDHVRGALKAWRLTCWEDIKGIRRGVGWDSLDELLARFFGWSVLVRTDLGVKHLKPTGKKTSQFKRDLEAGKAYYRMGYNSVIALISALKFSGLNVWRTIRVFKAYLLALRNPSVSRWVSEEQAAYINRYRYRSMLQN